jgi:hypothetical protein
MHDGDGFLLGVREQRLRRVDGALFGRAFSPSCLATPAALHEILGHADAGKPMPSMPFIRSRRDTL